MMLEDQYYERSLRKFLIENPGRNERDFIAGQITKFQEELKPIELEFRNLSVGILKKMFVKEYNLDLGSIEDLNFFKENFAHRAEQIKDDFKNQISQKEKVIYYYKLRLSRLPQPPYEQIDIKIKDTKDMNFPSYQIKWKGNNAELSELIKALIETNKLEPDLTQAEIFKRFSLFFDFKINETIGIRDFSKRIDSGGNLTKFLDLLKVNLENWFEKKETKKKSR